jgi:hypothetical protein
MTDAGHVMFHHQRFLFFIALVNVIDRDGLFFRTSEVVYILLNTQVLNFTQNEFYVRPFIWKCMPDESEIYTS